MDIFKALKLLDEGAKIRDIKMPAGVYLEKVDGKIISSQGRQGVDLNTDAEYKVYEETKPKYIDEICILFETIGIHKIEKCTYDCKECELMINNQCYRDKLNNIALDYNIAKQTKIIEKVNENIEKQSSSDFIKRHIFNYEGETFITLDTSKDLAFRIKTKTKRTRV